MLIVTDELAQMGGVHDFEGNAVREAQATLARPPTSGRSEGVE